MISKTTTLVLGAVMAASVMGSGAHAADAAAGKKVYNKCRACHSIDEGGPNKVGPNIHGIIGREAGKVEGYKYSKAMQASGITWSEEKLTEFLVAPKTVVPKTKMAFPGLKKPADIENLIAYIKEQ